MKYVALFRGINVGTSLRIDMRDLRSLFSGLGFGAVSTYINSGNVLFDSDEDTVSVASTVDAAVRGAYGEGARALVKDAPSILRIAAAIPGEWKNDDAQKTDVAYLFSEADRPSIVDDLPIRTEFLRCVYVPGAIVWNVFREDYSKSRLNRIVGHSAYRSMTVRNVNTARYLATALS
jgi:uncharacterized protein (DUF1697 family)